MLASNPLPVELLLQEPPLVTVSFPEYFWVLTISLMVVGAGGIVLAHFLQNKRGELIAREFGLCFAITGLTLALVESTFISTSKTALNAVRAENKAVLDQVTDYLINLESYVSPLTAREVRKQIIEPQIEYTNHKINGSVSVQAKPNGSKYLRWQLTTSYTVTSHKAVEEPWPVKWELLDIPEGFEVEMKKLSITPLGSNGVPTGDQGRVQLFGDAIEPYVSREPTSYLFTYQYEGLAPNTSYSVELTQVFESTFSDYYFFRTRYVTNRMELSVNYPDDQIRMAAGFMYPEADDPTRCALDVEGGAATLAIHGVVLPHQGLYLRWEPTQE